MSENPDQNAEAAKTHAKRAATQGKHAAKNTSHAAKEAAKFLAKEAEEKGEQGLHAVENAAVEVGDKTVDVGKKSVRKLDVIFEHIKGDTGQGILALTVAVWAGSIAFDKLTPSAKTFFLKPKAPTVVATPIAPAA